METKESAPAKQIDGESGGKMPLLKTLIANALLCNYKIKTNGLQSFLQIISCIMGLLSLIGNTL